MVTIGKQYSVAEELNLWNISQWQLLEEPEQTSSKPFIDHNALTLQVRALFRWKNRMTHALIFVICTITTKSYSVIITSY